MIKESQKKLLGKNNYNELLIKKLKSEIFWLKQENIDKNECIEAYLSMLDERDNRIDKAIEYIRENFADIEYMKARYNEKVINTHIAEISITDIEELYDILKGDKNE